MGNVYEKIKKIAQETPTGLSGNSLLNRYLNWRRRMFRPRYTPVDPGYAREELNRYISEALAGKSPRTPEIARYLVELDRAQKLEEMVEPLKKLLNLPDNVSPEQVVKKLESYADIAQNVHQIGELDSRISELVRQLSPEQKVQLPADILNKLKELGIDVPPEVTAGKLNEISIRLANMRSDVQKPLRQIAGFQTTDDLKAFSNIARTVSAKPQDVGYAMLPSTRMGRTIQTLADVSLPLGGGIAMYGLLRKLMSKLRKKKVRTSGGREVILEPESPRLLPYIAAGALVAGTPQLAEYLYANYLGSKQLGALQKKIKALENQKVISPGLIQAFKSGFDPTSLQSFYKRVLDRIKALKPVNPQQPTGTPQGTPTS